MSSASSVVDLFLKSFWSGWLDAMFQSDPVLNAYRRDEHEAMLKEFREVDRKIIQQGAARIIAILDPLQSKGSPLTPNPSPAKGEGSIMGDPDVTLLMKEAHKKTKHLGIAAAFRQHAGASCAAQAVHADEPAVGQPVPAGRSDCNSI